MTTESIKSLVGQLAGRKKPRTALPAAASRPAIPDATGFASPQPKSAASSAGIASPLTVSTMSGTSSLQMVSTDGFFVLNLPLEVNLTDASGRAVKVKFPA